MFLFNKYRNSRQENIAGNSTPKVQWKSFLNTNPLYGAESTATTDPDGNLYFGSHSGNFYSLDKKGKIRWTFSTEKKIYGSPLRLDNRIYFAGGDGFFYCLNLDGETQWKYNLGTMKGFFKRSKKINFIRHFPFTYDFKKRKNIVYRSWSSPNYSDGRLYITGYGLGLYCFDPNGKILWNYDLGFPRYQLSGVALDEEDHVYCASRRGEAYRFTKDGKLLWKKKLKTYGEPWGNPVVCHINKTVFFFFAKGEKEGQISALDYEGNIKWEKKIGAIRGSCAITKGGRFMYCCDLDGFIYKFNAQFGDLINKKRITKVSRGLWITPTLDGNEDILLATKDSQNTGRLIKLAPDLETIWEFSNNKILSVPIINEYGDIFIGSWDGHYYSLNANQP